MTAASQHQPRNRRSATVLTVLCMGGGCIYILPYLSQYLYLPMKDAMHLNNLQLSLMQSAMGFTSMLFYWPGGWMADRISPRKLITVSMLVNGLLGLWLATIPPFKLLLAIQLSMGVFLTLTYWSALIKLVRQLAAADQQGRYFGILEGGRNLAAVLVVAAGLYLFAWLGSGPGALRWTIILYSVVLLVIGLLSWIYLPETGGAGPRLAQAGEKIPLPVAIGRVLRLPAVWLTMFIILCVYVTSAGITYITPYATDVYRQSVVFGGMLATISQSTGIFASPSAGFVADRWTTSRTILWLLGALAFCLLLFAIVPGGPRLFLLLLFNSIAISCLMYALRGIYFALLEEGAVPIALTGTATGLISLVAFTPDVFIPALAGHLLDRYAAGGVGYRLYFLILAIFSLAGIGLTLLFRRRFSARPGQAA